MNVNEELERLRTETPRPQAKGELILKLQRKQEKQSMKLISKLGIPTALVAAGAVAVTLMLPRTALASPESVAKAIRQARTYIIKSFGIQDGKRTLMSTTTINNGKKSRISYDANGKPLPATDVPELRTADNGGKHTITFDGGGPRGDGQVRIMRNPEMKAGVDKHSVEVRSVKGPDGKQHDKFVVDGKEVDKLPAEMMQGVEMRHGKMGGPGRSVSVNMKDKNGARQDAAVVGMSGADGKTSLFASGQTSADYLLGILGDEDRWTIERHVMLDGVRYDKFTLKGPMSPIELYVDPGSSLPRILRFVDIGHTSTSIEDVYEYTTPTGRP